MYNLKPCPFCGGNVTYTQNDITGEHHIECLECTVLVLFDVDLLKSDVIAHWNTRTPVYRDDPEPVADGAEQGAAGRVFMSNSDSANITDEHK